MREPNQSLRHARLNLPSPSGSGGPMSRQELADRVNAYLSTRTRRQHCIDANYVGKLERGEHRWPNALYREAFRAVLNGATDAEIGFFVRRYDGAEPTPDRVEQHTSTMHRAVRPLADVDDSRPGLFAAPAIRGNLATRSTDRTRALLDAIRARPGTGLPYRAPVGAVDRMVDFLASRSRVFVTKGPSGSGKTRLTQHLVEELSIHADFQIHSVDSWDVRQLDLAAQILRFASTPAGDDPLLTLEHECADLDRPCLVVIDGLNSQNQLNLVGRQLDGILRQVTRDALRFLLIVRTPPDIEVSAHPVLAASIHEAPAQARGVSYWVSPWETAEAREVWDRSAKSGEPAFSDLPPSIQQLAKLPLYMYLLKAGGHSSSSAPMNAFRLVDHCVRAILHASGDDVERQMQELANLACQEMRSFVPSQLGHAENSPTKLIVGGPLLRTSPAGLPTFEHDVVREYFLATRIATLMAERGRSVATVSALNELGVKASTSATTRNLVEFVVYCLDRSAPELMTAVALSPTIGVSTTLPIMLKLAASGTAFATDEVLRACAGRCDNDNALELSRSLLTAPRITIALGSGYASWLIGLLRRFGSAIWSDVMRSVERTLDAQAASDLLTSTNLDDSDETIFFARYFFLFVGDDQDLAASLHGLSGHPDWRVRAALAEGLADEHSPPSAIAQTIMDMLVQDKDYKVRAAVAKAVKRAELAVAEKHIGTLLADDNWHVRESVLRAVMSNDLESAAADHLARTAIGLLVTDESWRRSPVHVGALAERLLLLHSDPGLRNESRAMQQALFELLRELRTGWLRLPTEAVEALVAKGHGCGNWLVQREADGFRLDGTVGDGSVPRVDAPARRETFRRLRNSRAVQVALDLHDLDHAADVATAAAAAGVDFIEVGDPLIKTAGLAAVERIKRQIPGTAVVAEMMSADWGRDQVVQAAEAGADVVLLIGPATIASVSAAVDAGRRLGVPILLDIPTGRTSERWIRDMERAGVDGFAITTNIDLGVGGRHPLSKARTVRSWTRLPVAVSGGFSTTDHSIVHSSDWDILIVGRSIAEAIQPAAAARQLLELTRGRADEGVR